MWTDYTGKGIGHTQVAGVWGGLLIYEKEKMFLV